MKRPAIGVSKALTIASFVLLGTAAPLSAQSPPRGDVAFLRGDVDGSGVREVTDAIRLLGNLFLGSPATLQCSDAADSNDDGILDVSDASFVLGFLFLGGVIIPPPFAACGVDPTADLLDCAFDASCAAVTPFEIRRSLKDRELEPQVAAEDFATMVAGNAAAAVDLYHEARAVEEGNIFFSPHSISIALAMTLAGARGETAQEMAAALHFDLPEDRLHAALNVLDQELARRGDGLEDKEGDGFALTVANSVWGQRAVEFFDEFLDVLAVNYGAAMRLLDFVREPESSRLVINEWVEEQTNERIQDLIPEGVIQSTTRLVLTNAIFFKASWKTPFEETATRDAPFTLLDGQEVTVSMMSLDATFGYFRGENYQAMELPYLGDTISMLVLLPDEGQFGEVESGLDAAFLEDAVSGLTSQRLLFSMPKFEFEFRLPLKNALINMGMAQAFSQNLADFSGIADTDQVGDLYIQDVLHKAFIAVDEKGTEAAAATAVVIGVTSVPPAVVLDRPFLFLIRDIPTGSILFLGRVAVP